MPEITMSGRIGNPPIIPTITQSAGDPELENT
jgi:hypothetical protein